MRDAIISLFIHFLFFLFLALIQFNFNSGSKLSEVPVDIFWVQKRSHAPNALPSKIQSSISQIKIKPQSIVQNSEVSEQTDSGSKGETVAEEYEVRELPLLLNEVKIPYPDAAKKSGVQGAVVFNLTISSKGEVMQIDEVSSPSLVLSEAATRAVKKFKFRPAKIADIPVAIKIRYTYRFVLQ